MIIGIGNEDRGDDGIGARVVRRIAELRPDLDTRILRADGLSLLDAWTGVETVVLVDAVQAGGPAGSVVRVDATERPVPYRAHASTHGLGVAEAIELGRSLGKLPQRLVFIGVEGSHFDLGRPPSPAVADSVEEAMRRVLEEVGT